jgi:hypothetical protein
MSNHPRRDSHRGGSRWHVTHHDRIRTDSGVSPNFDGSEYLGARANVYVASDYGHSASLIGANHDS